MEKEEFPFTEIKLARAAGSEWTSLDESLLVWDVDTKDVEMRLHARPFSEAGELIAHDLCGGKGVDVVFESGLGHRAELYGALLEKAQDESAEAHWDNNIAEQYKNVIVLRGRAKAFRERR